VQEENLRLEKLDFSKIFHLKLFPVNIIFKSDPFDEKFKTSFTLKTNLFCYREIKCQ